MRSALQLGVDDYFVKPFQPAQLIDSVLFLRDRRLRWQTRGLVEPMPASVSETT
jgi:DNA-binding response OmpR family regulator